MKIIKLLFSKPGVYLYLMILWAFFPMPETLYRYLIGEFSIYDLNLYIVPFVCCLAMVLLLNLIDLASGFWGKMNYWLKYIILNSTYTLLVFLACTITMILDHYDYIDYIGDAGGTIVMAYLPTIILYAIFGIPVTVFFAFKTRKAKRQFVLIGSAILTGTGGAVALVIAPMTGLVIAVIGAVGIMTGICADVLKR